MTTSFFSFLVTAAALAVMPGLDTALVVRTAASEGARRAMLAALGIFTGCLVWTAVVAAGLGALLAASQLAYGALRWVGAVYLVWIGVSLLRRPRTALALKERECGRGRHRGGSPLVRGTLTNLLNPKVGMFYVSFLPQFVPNDAFVAPYMALLGITLALLGLLWLVCLIVALRPLLRWLEGGSALKTLDRLTGGVFVALGVALLIDQRKPT